ncbi:flagellar basal-body rod protein FlgF [Myxococcota bacterium]|nr:flagellar basal-body rod protein FlgF [Myxococcota bacterium]
MPGAIYIGMSGMLTFARSLDVLSNNVANLNTPGFKRSGLLFDDLFYRQSIGSGPNPEGRFGLGMGVGSSGTFVNFNEGDIRDTGNDTDVALEGNGFFVLKTDERDVYTRAGQFSFDSNGDLIASDGSPVAGIDANGNPTVITRAGYGTSAPLTTNKVSFANNLSVGSSSHTVEDVPIFDTLGVEHKLRFLFKNNSSVVSRSWLIEAYTESDTFIANVGEIRFSGDGSPLENYSSATFTFAPDDALPHDVTLDFGTPGEFGGATSFSGGADSTLSFTNQDGRGLGSLTGSKFDEDGVLKFQYSNGATESGARLALAWFENLQDLEQLGEGRFSAEGLTPITGVANTGVMGRIAGSSLEISNVELTQQFTELIIVQRGFQASSQVLTTANEMIQELIENSRSRR